MASSQTVLSPDGQFKVRIEAFKYWAFFYSAIGSTVWVWKKTKKRGWFGSTSETWDTFRAPSLSVSNSYEGVLAILGGPAVASRSAAASNSHSCDERVWAFGFGVSIDASSRDGLPDPSTTGSGFVSRIELRKVTGMASVNTGGGVISIGPVVAM
jgi:hypothetical protein